MTTLISMIALVVLPLHAKSTSPESTKTVILSIPGMTCPVCPITIKKTLQHITGVNKVSIDFETKMATVVFNPNKVQISDLTTATNNAGYPSSVDSKPWILSLKAN
ncbi:TPA: mercury resistance system periplasmic binding protein MerP [Legionella pneumophila]